MDATEQQWLIHAAIAGETAAIEQLLLDCHDRLAAAITPRIPREFSALISAEDVCQEAYIAAVRALATFESRGDDAFFRWLLTTADRKLSDTIRILRAIKRGGGRAGVANARNDDSSVVAMLELAAVHAHTPSRSAARRELVQSVQDAVERLPEHYRDAVRMHYIEGLAVVETARRMGRSEPSVLKLFQRGLERLRVELGDLQGFLSHSA